MITTRMDPTIVDPIKVKVNEELRSIVPTYMESRREDVRQLRRALALVDYQSVVYMAHVIRGNGAAFGFDRLSALGHDLEWAALKENSGLATEAVDEMASYLERVEVEYVPEAVAPLLLGES